MPSTLPKNRAFTEINLASRNRPHYFIVLALLQQQLKQRVTFASYKEEGVAKQLIFTMLPRSLAWSKRQQQQQQQQQPGHSSTSCMQLQ
jgi:hypothetical protein